MSKLKVEITDNTEIVIYGLSKFSNDKTISKDIMELSEKYKNIIGKDLITPYFVLSKNYDENTKDFELFIGSIFDNKKLEQIKIPKGKYAKITIKPKMKFMWGLSIGGAKRYFYTEWIKNSEYKPLNMEYEYHTEKSIGKNPTIDLIFFISETNL